MYRKLKADRIFDGYRFRAGEVLITTTDGTIEAIVPAADAGADAEELNGTLCPGFINCHCHLELSHMKGLIPEKTGLVDFVFRIVSERHHSESAILEAIAAAEDELLGNGTVAVGDICNNDLTIAQKKKGRLHYSNFIEASGWLPSLANSRMDRARQLYEAYGDVPGSDRSVVPHAPYSVSQELWTAITPYFRGQTVSMHNQETAFEDEFFQQGSGDFLRMYELMKINNEHHRPTGLSSLLSCFERLVPAARVLLVHNTFTRQEDIDGLKTFAFAPDVFFCLCANANLYIEDRMPPVELLRANRCTIVVGTDSLASNHQLSIPEELRTIRAHFPQLPLEELLQWATSNGARALGLAARLGSFEEGRKPGILLLNEETLEVDRIDN